MNLMSTSMSIEVAKVGAGYVVRYSAGTNGQFAAAAAPPIGPATLYFKDSGELKEWFASLSDGVR